jgi:hypothetical protein
MCGDVGLDFVIERSQISLDRLNEVQVVSDDAQLLDIKAIVWAQIQITFQPYEMNSWFFIPSLVM